MGPAVTEHGFSIWKDKPALGADDVVHLFFDFLHGLGGEKTIIIQTDELFPTLEVIQKLLDISFVIFPTVHFTEKAGGERPITQIPSMFQQSFSQFFLVWGKTDLQIGEGIALVGFNKFPFFQQGRQQTFERGLVKPGVQPASDFFRGGITV